MSAASALLARRHCRAPLRRRWNKLSECLHRQITDGIIVVALRLIIGFICRCNSVSVDSDDIAVSDGR